MFTGIVRLAYRIEKKTHITKTFSKSFFKYLYTFNLIFFSSYS